MSRVRNALKLAEDWEGKSVFTGEAVTAPLAPRTYAPVTLSTGRVREASEASPLFDTEPVSPKSSAMSRWLRRWTRRFLRTATPVPRCTGVTRRGMPCRAPAMDNGLCRMHGGARVMESSPSRLGIVARLLPSRLLTLF